MPRIGAPKVFYDQSTSQYLLTWHTTHALEDTDLPEPYWAGQRTLYATSKDLKTFSDPPRKLFQWELATIDAIVRRIGDRYYAVIEDERYPSLEWPTGKTIRPLRGIDGGVRQPALNGGKLPGMSHPGRLPRGGRCLDWANRPQSEAALAALQKCSGGRTPYGKESWQHAMAERMVLKSSHPPHSRLVVLHK